MQQRRLRLGDILDDYCPRERRITNHAIVAMIDDQVKQTRCTTCDADHEYKQARVPPPRRRKESSVEPSVEHNPEEAASTETSIEETPVEEVSPPEEPVQHAEEGAADLENENESETETETEPERSEDEGPVHRRLIRATLPRPEGQSPERKVPEFTRPGGRGREFNGNRGGGGGQRHGRGHRAQGSFSGPSRFGTPRPNSPQGGQRGNGNRSGPGGGQRGGRPQGQRGPGRKRGR